MSAAKNQQINKRKHERYPVSVMVKVRAVGAKTWNDGRMINLSRGGTCIESPLGFFVGQVLEIITLNQDGSESHILRASVAWKNKFRHGVSFI